ncbi:hypothetical protein HKX69_15910 [Streptomyces argyrophyllae]|uniref:Uncharacterized protein n=1 Tax=Streptomyces argyrophylli TaxID=2726118 RepID=A0A6M4PI98_9ACTN|nr:hypothetical protein [Streptomyces argyrophyllae]QJS10801.1 hypothetical protein HKX69_15910 [Streptomyces argyrophyllae]
MNPTIRELLDTADRLVAGNADLASGGLHAAEAGATVSDPPTVLTATTASRCRGAAFALRAALESAVAARLTAHGAPRATREGNMRAAFLWLRGCVEAGTARRAKAAWSQLCLGCHYHQYEIGPTEDQVRAWRSEVAALVALMSR